MAAAATKSQARFRGAQARKKARKKEQIQLKKQEVAEKKALLTFLQMSVL